MKVATTLKVAALPGVHEHVATPDESAIDEQPAMAVPLIVKATLPVAEGEIVAVSVTGCPSVGDAEYVSASEVVARTTIDFVSLDVA